MPVPGWRLRTWRAASMPSRWKVGRHPDVGHHHLGVGLLGGRHQLVVVGGDADHLEVGLEPEQGPHALAHQHVVVGQHHGDPVEATIGGAGGVSSRRARSSSGHQTASGPAREGGQDTDRGVVLARRADGPASALGRLRPQLRTVDAMRHIIVGHLRLLDPLRSRGRDLQAHLRAGGHPLRRPAAATDRRSRSLARPPTGSASPTSWRAGSRWSTARSSTPATPRNPAGSMGATTVRLGAGDATFAAVGLDDIRKPAGAGRGRALRADRRWSHRRARRPAT